MTRTLTALSLAAGLFATQAAAAVTPRTPNEKVVVDFYYQAFNAHQPKAASERYIGAVYIQHNPLVPNGTPAFYNYFGAFFKDHPEASLDIKHVVGEGDLVVVHSLFRSGPQDRGQAIMDLFRVEHGKIVEHWDVIQPVPAQTANGNTMFEGTKSN